MSVWRWLVVVLLVAAMPLAARAGEFPWKAGDPPPPVAGVRLGDGLVRLQAVLGQPSTTEKLGKTTRVLTYRKRGLQIIYAPLDGVAIIFLQSRAAGDIGGVSLGDTREEVLGRWGKPAAVQEGTAYYLVGSSWLVLVKLDEHNRVKELGLGRFIENPPKDAKFYRKKD